MTGKVVIALDSFKGSLSSLAAGEAVAEGIRRACPSANCVIRPLADGGEGTTAALVDGLGGSWRSVAVTGPVGRKVTARYGILPGHVAVIEMAVAAGITLVSAAERNPRLATTYGVGEMIVDAARQGARHFIVGIGGSATNDGGAGMLQALGWRLLDKDGADLPRGGAALSRLERIVPPSERSDVDFQLSTCKFRVACDVTNPLCGPTGASAVFGPQKGATPEDVCELDDALAHFAKVAARGVETVPGVGAAGGLGYAFRAFLDAELMPGVDLILRETHLEDEIRDADVVVTGEGRIDAQTVMGKAPIGVARLAKRYGKMVVAFCGCAGAGASAVNAAGIDAYFPILRSVTTQNEALDVRTASANLSDTVEQVFRIFFMRNNWGYPNG